MNDRTFPLSVLAAWGVLLAAVTVACVALAGGQLIYTLDDPYIHLAVAETILGGGYGVNAGEYASPSSSILWPWLMAGTEAMGLGMAGPLVVNVLAAGATVLLACRFLVKNGAAGEGRLGRFLAGLVVVLLTSAVALPLTGMEHSLHVLLTVAAVDGLVDVAERRRMPWYLVPALAFLPLVRFEGVALAGAGIVLLLLFRRWGAAVATALASLAGLSLYGAFAAAHGLPFFPSSVLLKSDAVSTGSGAAMLLDAAANLMTRAGLCLLLSALLLLFLAAVQRRAHPRMALVYLAGAGVVAAHLLAGRIGWFFRYEVYCAALAGLLLFQAFALFVRQGRKPPLRPVFLSALLGVMAVDYALAAVASPFAARNVYEQQYQMRRFAQDFYRAPVAVNDLGLVSYGNPAYVLDLWGLGSEAVRTLRAAHRYDAAAMARLTRESHVGLVMIYDDWFPALPPEWTPVATLTTTDNYVAGGARVTFLATPDADLPALRAALENFAGTLPARVEFRLETAENAPST